MFVKFDDRKNRIILQSKKGDAIRQINVANLAKLNVCEENVDIVKMMTSDKTRPMILVQIPREYDMVTEIE